MIHLEISVSDGRKFNRKFSHQSLKPLMDTFGFFLGLRNSEIIRIGWMEAPRVLGHSFFKGPGCDLVLFLATVILSQGPVC